MCVGTIRENSKVIPEIPMWTTKKQPMGLWIRNWYFKFQTERVGGGGVSSLSSWLWGSLQLPVRPLWGAGWCYMCFLILKPINLQTNDRGVPWSIHLSVWVCSNQRKENMRRRDSGVRGKKGKKDGEVWQAINSPHTLLIKFLCAWLKLMVQCFLSYVCVVAAGW